MRMIVALLLLASATAVDAQGRRQTGPDEDVNAVNRPASYSQFDPWERTNRKVHGFNKKLDQHVMKPVARGYVRVVPRPARQGVANFFNNLQQPVVSINLMAQGKAAQSGRAILRFLVNTTVGIGGIFDPATKSGAPYYEADFGQTFAKWGWNQSRYIVLPVFGPSTVRDGGGRFINSRVSPINRLSEETGPATGILYGITSRASALPNEAFLEGAEDDYLLLRDVYFQRRNCQLHDCTQETPDYELPEDLGVEE